MPWYLQKSDGSVYGPHEEAVLQQWAADGRIGPEDLVSEDQQDWRPAADLPSLRMDWLVRLDSGALYGPFNLEALAILAQSGELSDEAEVVHRLSARRYTLSQALAVPPEQAAAGPPVGESEASAGPVDHIAWREIVVSRDRSEREARKWKQCFEEERERAEQERRALNDRLEELRKSERAARVQLEQAERRLSELRADYERLEESVRKMPGGDQTARAITWMESYQDLSRRYDRLMEQLTAKNQEVQEAQRARAKAEEEALRLVDQMEAVVAREREEAQRARQRLAEMEEAHLQLVRAYRELNERYIRAREQATRPPAAPPAGPRIPLRRP